MQRSTTSESSRGPKSSSATSRAPWGSISRDHVVAEAMRIVATDGYNSLTMSALARELGVAPMSLYRHVADKDDLLDEVVDRLLAKAWRPTVSRSDWRGWTVQAADKLRRFLVAQPAALHIYLQHPVVSEAAVARMNAMMDVLRSGVGDEEAARQAYAAIHTYTLGFAALEAGRAGWTPPDDEIDGLARQLATHTSRQQFIEGLNYLLDGIET